MFAKQITRSFDDWTIRNVDLGIRESTSTVSQNPQLGISIRTSHKAHKNVWSGNPSAKGYH